MITNHTIILFSFCIILLSISCQKITLNKRVPKCIKQKIKVILNDPVTNPPRSVWEWKVDGETYYYITSGCCDQYNYLYDEKCNLICAPDGGFTGTGDGNCPTFNGQIEATLVWEDDR